MLPQLEQARARVGGNTRIRMPSEFFDSWQGRYKPESAGHLDATSQDNGIVGRQCLAGNGARTSSKRGILIRLFLDDFTKLQQSNASGGFGRALRPAKRRAVGARQYEPAPGLIRRIPSQTKHLG